ncbi:peroxisome biogenesis factor 10 [Contarinia nasturtii]|uniref:peroxisome biogenesis factor 10 n=1 Tax=Contarinia nasturtii TaxID=265458 RepID=UPI0012D3E892|nr:peroxisome biogenesis factor 10 [Contarinia nasturtii]
MSFYYANARQPEILRTLQKDATFTNQLGHDLSDILRFTNKHLWIKYNSLCTLLMELAYHGFASYNNLQTLGEEYTGIIQIDSKYIALPSKLLQMLSIIMEYAGEQMLVKLIRNVEHEIERNAEIRPEAKIQLVRCCSFLLHAIPYIQAMHRTWFYFYGGKYQISRRFTGINYVLIRHWLNVKHSVYGYKVLGAISLLQLMLVFAAFVKEVIRTKQVTKDTIEKVNHLRDRFESTSQQNQSKNELKPKCVLCFEERRDTCTTLCGHLFCWSCIMDWLDQREECPVCREPTTKSNVVYLMNFS